MKYPYRLILISNGKQKESMGFFHTELQGLRAMNEKSKEAIENVKVPIKFINKTKIEEVKYELVLIKKRDENDPLVSKVRNEYGEFVDHESNNDMWLIIDKAPYNIEENFWVYGYHPLSDRKNFNFIMNEIIVPRATSKKDFLIVKLFLNKIIFSSQSDTNLVTCKNKQDAIRLYNTICNECQNEKKKIKYICFYGDCNSTKMSRDICIDEIANLTNWNKQKIVRLKTKTQNGNRKKKKQ